MTTQTSALTLDLAQQILEATISLTKAELQDKQSPPTVNGHGGVPAVANGINGHHEVNGHADPKTKTSSQEDSKILRQSPQDIVNAKIKLVQAAADLTALVQGPANYLKSWSYGVR